MGKDIYIFHSFLFHSFCSHLTKTKKQKKPTRKNKQKNPQFHSPPESCNLKFKKYDLPYAKYMNSIPHRCTAGAPGAEAEKAGSWGPGLGGKQVATAGHSGASRALEFVPGGSLPSAEALSPSPRRESLQVF